jgi:predicted transcriptional regulator
MAEILAATKDRPLTKTHVMYAVFLTFVQIQEYTQELLTKGFLSYNEENKTLQTTKQGLEYLKLYQAMQKL